MAIALRGSAPVSSFANNGGNVTVNLSGLSLQENDVVVACVAAPKTTGSTPAMVSSGWTQVITPFVGTGSQAPSMGVWYKRMGASPDSSVEMSGDTSSQTDTTGIAIAFSGVDTSTALDQTAVISSETTSTNPDPSAIVTQTDGAEVIVFATSNTLDTSITVPSGYSNHYQQDGNDTYDHTQAVASKNVASAGSENPPSWTDWSSGIWRAVTLALRPVVVDPNVTVNAGVLSVASSPKAPTILAGLNAISLSGSGQYAQVDNFAAIDAMTDGTGTVEGWFWNDPASGAYASGLSLGSGTTNTTYLITENGTGNEGVNFAWAYSGTSADGYRPDSVFTQSTWVHVAAVYTNGAVTKVYVNGTEISYNLQQTPSGTPVTADGAGLRIGARWEASFNYWKGKIGGFVRVWNTARTQTQIDDNKALTLQTSGETGLIINLNFTEQTGATIENESSPGDDANLISSPTWTNGPTTTPKSYGSSVTVTPSAITAATALLSPTISTVQNVTVTPNAQTIVSSPNAPTITAIQNVTVSPSVQTTALTLYSPTVTGSALITPSAQSTAISLYSPTITVISNITVLPNAISLTATAQSVTVSTATNVTVTPDSLSLSLSLFSPTTIGTASVSPNTNTGAFALQTPTITAVQNVTVSQNTQTATLALFSPTATGSAQITPSAQTTALALYFPTVTGNATVSANTQTGAFALYAPTVIAGGEVIVSAGTQATTLALYSPTVTAVQNVTVSAGVQTGTFALNSPTVSTEAIVSAGVQSATFSPQSPTVSGSASVSAGIQSTSFSLYAPTVSTATDVTVTPDAQSATVTPYSPTIVAEGGNVTVSVGVQALTFSPQSTTVSTVSNVTVYPPTLSLGGGGASKLILVDGNLALNVGGIYHIGI